MNLLIENFQMRLPAGYGPRAASIARLTMEVLAHAKFSTDTVYEHLRVPAVQVAAQASDQDVAGSIAAAILTQLHAVGITT